MEKIKIAAIQMSTVADKMENVRTVKTYLEKIKDENPDFVILPEMFCCPYQTENFPIYAEKEGGPVWQQLSGYAKQYGIYLIGGSMPEKDDGSGCSQTLALCAGERTDCCFQLSDKERTSEYCSYI